MTTCITISLTQTNFLSLTLLSPIYCRFWYVAKRTLNWKWSWLRCFLSKEKLTFISVTIPTPSLSPSLIQSIYISSPLLSSFFSFTFNFGWISSFSAPAYTRLTSSNGGASNLPCPERNMKAKQSENKSCEALSHAHSLFLLYFSLSFTFYHTS